MCELLIKATDYNHPDPDKDRAGAYKRGMIVRIESDGHIWGSEEGLPKFVIVKIPGVAVEKAQALTYEQTENDDGTKTNTIYRRRRWKLLVNNIPKAIRNKLLADGEVTVTKTQIRNYLKRIRDNARYTGMD